MLAGDCEAGVAGAAAADDDSDTLEFLELLMKMKLHDTALCQRTTDELARECLDKFDDPRARSDHVDSIVHKRRTLRVVA